MTTLMVRYARGRPGRSQVMRLRPTPFPPALSSRLRGALVRAHARQPFTPTGPREAVERISMIAGGFGLTATVYRGGVDLGTAELDHVWAVIDSRVVDVSLPLHSKRFVAALRAYVAGDLDDERLEFAAHPYSLSWRVVGEFPEDIAYLGAPVWRR